MARQILQMRRAREQQFPSEIFDEFAWDILLTLFSALAENEILSEDELVRRSCGLPSVGRRWLRHLSAEGHLRSRQDGDDVELSPAAVANLRSFLDNSSRIFAEPAPV